MQLKHWTPIETWKIASVHEAHLRWHSFAHVIRNKFVVVGKKQTNSAKVQTTFNRKYNKVVQSKTYIISFQAQSRGSLVTNPTGPLDHKIWTCYVICYGFTLLDYPGSKKNSCWWVVLLFRSRYISVAFHDSNYVNPSLTVSWCKFIKQHSYLR